MKLDIIIIKAHPYQIQNIIQYSMRNIFLCDGG